MYILCIFLLCKISSKWLRIDSDNYFYHKELSLLQFYQTIEKKNIYIYRPTHIIIIVALLILKFCRIRHVEACVHVFYFVISQKPILDKININLTSIKKKEMIIIVIFFSLDNLHF